MPHADSHSSGPSRREFLASGLSLGALALAAPALGGIRVTPTPLPASGPGRALRFAHPTDIHVRAKDRGAEGMRACFEHMFKGPDAPGLVITGGDLPMDSASTPEKESAEEWGLYLSTIQSTVPKGVPIYHTLGNHDIFGRDKKASETTGNEPNYGRKWFLKNFGYERTYRSFDQAGWHFIILDSIDLKPDGDEFTARISGEQLAWLKDDLAASKGKNTVVVSHVPVMSVANYFDSDDEEWAKGGPDLKVSSKRMHVDCRELEAMFRAHGGIKLCLSGHLHLLDRCTYNGITYICDGAVSGAKWKGSKRQTFEGYGLIDLFEDGTFAHQYVAYGWKAGK